MMDAVLDASALLALLLGEPGSKGVQTVLASSAMSDVNLSEIVAYFARHGVEEREIRLVLDPLPIERHPFDGHLAYIAGLLVPATKQRGLSLGDRACLALAKQLGVKAVTADRSWLHIANAVGVEVEVIR